MGVHRVGVDVPTELVQVAAASGARVQEEMAVRLKAVTAGSTDLLRQYEICCIIFRLTGMIIVSDLILI